MPSCNLGAASCTLFNALVNNLLNPAMLLLTGVAAVFFLFGMVEFLWETSEGKDVKKGKDHMLWGLVGLFIMVAAYAIIVSIEGTVIGLGGGQ